MFSGISEAHMREGWNDLEQEFGGITREGWGGVDLTRAEQQPGGCGDGGSEF
jgi:hypothetical protein